MNLADVMDEIADQLRTIDGLRVFAYPPDQPPPAPAAIVTFPDSYTYDATYGRGMDRISDLPVVLLVGKVSDRTARDRIAKYVNGSGTDSVKAVLEAGTYTAFDTLRCVRVQFDRITFGGTGNEYLAATIILDIAGSGA